jgi:formyltetrahydrofolate-dependent phosphoribosylglycinamide formyltransferase
MATQFFGGFMLRLVVCISGGGTNLQALIDAIEQEQLDAKIVLVVSNRKDAYGLERARHAGIDTLYFPLKPFTEGGQTRAEYDTVLAEKLAPYAPDLIVLAGWMHIFTSAFLDLYFKRVINLHPALPGQFAGVNAIQRAYAAFQRGEIDHSGIMVHYAIPEVDAGEVLVTEEVPIEADDTVETFAARMHTAEHRLIVEAVRQHARKNPA